MANVKTSRKGPIVVENIHYRKNKYAAPIGGIFIALAVIGIIALTIFCVNFTQKILDNSGEKEKFEKIITPVLMFDPVPFENIKDADPLFLLQSSVWSTLLGEKRESYQFDSLERLQVPASDVDVTCSKLFGAEAKLEHQSFGNIDTANVYDQATKTYFIPVKMQTAMYAPSIERIIKKGNEFDLTVGYIAPSTAWTQTTAGKTGKPQPDKYMEYILRKTKEAYQLVAIRDVVGIEGTNEFTPPIEGTSPEDLASSQESSSLESSST